MNLEQKIQTIYNNAYKKARPLVKKKLKEFEKQDAIKRQQLAEHSIALEEYKSWLRTQFLMLPEVREALDLILEMLDVADQQVTQVLQTARVDEYEKGALAAIAMIGAALVGTTMGARQSQNIVAGALKLGISVTVKDVGPDVTKITKANVIEDFYNKKAFEKMANSTKSFLPAPSEKTLERIRRERLKIWNKQKLNSQVIKGLSKGDSVPKIAESLQQTFNMDDKQAVRNARTMITAMRNKATLDKAREALAAGIPVFKRWESAHDSRVRDSHFHMNGEEQPLEQPFSNGLMYPAEPNGDVSPSEIYNCRCTLIIDIAGEEFVLDRNEMEELV